MRSAALAALLCCGCAGVLSGQSSVADRKALVIGNALYKALAEPPTAANDARLVANALGGANFVVSLVENRSLEQLGRDIARFLSNLSPGDAAVVYFTGYALQSGGENYLLPVDFALDKDIDFAAYSAKRLVRDLEARKLQPAIVLFDAARQAPALGGKYPDVGLALLDLRAPETVVGYSTLPGRSLPDAPGRTTGRYAAALAEAIGQPGLSLNDALARVKRAVATESQGAQTPAEISTSVRDFVFRKQLPQQAEWDRLKTSTDVAALNAFRLKYPGDPLANEALVRVEDLEWQAVANSGDPTVLRGFLNRHPRGAHAAAAQGALDGLARLAQQQAREMILATLQRYREAYQDKDIERLKSLRPGFSRNDLRNLEETFRFARQVKMDLEPAGDPQVDADLATVRCRQTIQLRDERGAMPAAKSDVLIKLRRSADGWVIEAIQ